MRKSEGIPAVVYEYLSPEETMPTEPTNNPDFCHQVALRRAVGAMRQKGDSTVQFAFAPANDSDKGDIVPATNKSQASTKWRIFLALL